MCESEGFRIGFRLAATKAKQANKSAISVVSAILYPGSSLSREGKEPGYKAVVSVGYSQGFRLAIDFGILWNIELLYFSYVHSIATLTSYYF